MSLLDQLRDCIGMWVAVQGENVLYAGGSPKEIIEWLNENGQVADSCFRVPVSEQNIGR